MMAWLINHRVRVAAVVVCSMIAFYFGVSALYAFLHYDSYAAATPQLVRYLLVPALLSVSFIVCGFVLPEGASLLIALNGAAVMVALFTFEAVLTSRTLPSQFDLLGQLDAGLARDDLVRGVGDRAIDDALGVDRLSEAMLAGLPDRRTLLCTKDGAPVAFD
ncbi:MAG: hypothetical protein ACREH6_12540, partial [Geminicoccaceae bacterium]